VQVTKSGDGAKQQLEQHYNEAILALQNLAMYNKPTNLLRQFADGFKIRNF